MYVVYTAAIARRNRIASRPRRRLSDLGADWRRPSDLRADVEVLAQICPAFERRSEYEDIDEPFHLPGDEDALELLLNGGAADDTELSPTKGLSLDPDEFLEQEARREKVLKMQDAVRPGRTTPIAIRIDRFTLRRLQALATLRGTRYQTLIKQFVVERLYEEEKRAGIIDG